MFPENTDKEGRPKVGSVTPTSKQLIAYNRSKITCAGTVELQVRFDQSKWQQVTFYVVDVTGPPIMGLETCELLKVVTMHRSIEKKVTTLRSGKIEDTQCTGRSKNCMHCGRKHKIGRQHCPARYDDCNKCKKKGHWSRICMSTKEGRRNILALQNGSQAEEQHGWQSNGKLQVKPTTPPKRVQQQASRTNRHPSGRATRKPARYEQ